MKLMFHFDSHLKDVWSGRTIDFDMWMIFRDIWASNQIAVINTSGVEMNTAGRDGIVIYENIWQFYGDFMQDTMITLEHPKHSPSEYLSDHTFDDNAWYCIGPSEGWGGSYLPGSATLGIEQDGNAELHSPFVSAVLSYTRYMRG